MGIVVWLLGLGVVALIWVLHSNGVKKAAAAANWPTVQGTVRNSGVDTRTNRTKNGRRTTYAAQVTYDYAVAGTTYSGRDITTGMEPSYSYESQARAIADRYPSGATVTVRHNPQNPAEAVLEVKKPGKAVSIVLTVIVLFLTMILATVFSVASSASSYVAS